LAARMGLSVVGGIYSYPKSAKEWSVLPSTWDIVYG